MREKFIAVFFLIVIMGIPVLTLTERVIHSESEVTYDSKRENNTIAEINREEQLKMQEQIKFDSENSMKDTKQKNLLKESVENFTDDLTFTEEAVKVTNNITAALSDDEYIDSNQVLAGKGGWLFYKRTDDGNAMADYQGTSEFSDNTMEEIKDSLLQQRQIFEEKGVRFVVMIIPNKEIIYSEYMPSTVSRVSEITRCDKLYEFLNNNTDLEIVYPKSDLIKAKEVAQVYYKYDTHWNKVGAYVGTQSLLSELYGTYQEISQSDLRIEHENMSGDLAALINLSEKYNDDIECYVAEDSYNKQQQVVDKLLIVGDSFSDLMMNDLEYYFEEVNQVGVWMFKMNMLDEYKPDIVLWECVERYADRLNWINLTEK